jgi:transposase
MAGRLRQTHSLISPSPLAGDLRFSDLHGANCGLLWEQRVHSCVPEICQSACHGRPRAAPQLPPPRQVNRPGDLWRLRLVRGWSHDTTRQGSQKLRERAVRPVFEHQDEHPSQWAAICSIAHKFGVSSETLREWVRRAETDDGLRPGLTSKERERLKGLEREVRELRRANEILKAASAFFAATPQTRRGRLRRPWRLPGQPDPDQPGPRRHARPPRPAAGPARQRWLRSRLSSTTAPWPPMPLSSPASTASLG